ncbi:hypothetical protein AJ80_00009 [Polytolypa hystricis UAMH7299]|uniref:Zn(2)-C6 fungal-type domain-containing protein n=1 Tax=Polytolypa hystricis (strain UAMH7299) TaxID=1447883 RepID=A0A2B7Z4F2_POLH7|nr:hypothetical protein AJ80_00009 [Polytolypa hystricis UAMH7299]
MLKPISTHSPTSPPSPHRGTKRHAPDETPPIPSYQAYPTPLFNSEDPTHLHSTDYTPRTMTTGVHPPQPGYTTAFRNVSACNRCRLRKNRCDQSLPQCQSCEKARVHCVGYDPTTKREIPRSYVFFLESRVAYLEHALRENGVEVRPAEAHEGEAELGKPPGNTTLPEGSLTGSDGGTAKGPNTRSLSDRRKTDLASRIAVTIKREPEDGSGSISTEEMKDSAENRSGPNADRKEDENDTDRGIDNLVSNIGMVSVQGASDSRYLGSTSGISFARVVLAAVKRSVASTTSDRGAVRPADQERPGLGGNATTSSMRDSFFGLQGRPMMNQAPFPEKGVARSLVDLFFEHANPQIPILHRGDFLELFERVYSVEPEKRSARDLYMLNIVCAIGGSIIFDGSDDVTMQDHESKGVPVSPSHKRQKVYGQKHQPEEYHASAVVHLGTLFGSSPAGEGSIGGLEELQAVLLLANFALLRPVAPGLWYIVGVAVRLAIDLGLHYEDGTGLDSIGEHDLLSRQLASQADASGNPKPKLKIKLDSGERGRREWMRDLRRRLWWCVYCFDRLVSTCVGRPFGITDQVITTEFPSLLDDEYITKKGFRKPPADNTPSYKHVAHHYIKLRLLQSEIQQVLQFRQAKMVRNGGKNQSNAYMHTKLPSPFLQNFDSFRAWRQDVDRRLLEWKDSAPTKEKNGVQFSVEFLELNYWQALIMLYRQSLTVPEQLARGLSPAEDVSSPSFSNTEDEEDEDDIYWKVAAAGREVLRIYRRLHRIHLVNYTYLATHHLFMAGISFLYAIWHSPAVRIRLTFDDVDTTILAGTSVLEDLMKKCPPAEACRDAFKRMSDETIKMCLSTTGFGSSARANAKTLAPDVRQYHTAPSSSTSSSTPRNLQDNAAIHQLQQYTRVQPQLQTTQAQGQRSTVPIDYGFDGLFSDKRIGNMELPPQVQYRNEQHNQQHMLQSQYPTQPQYPLSQMRHQPQNYDNSHSPQQQQQQQVQYTNNYPPPSDPIQPYNPSPTPEQSSFSPANFNFLDIDASPHASYQFQPYDPSASGDMDSSPGEATMVAIPTTYGQGGPNGTRFELPYGMALDDQHDWSDRTGYGIFDGYFFGDMNGNAGV